MLLLFSVHPSPTMMMHIKDAMVRAYGVTMHMKRPPLPMMASMERVLKKSWYKYARDWWTERERMKMKPEGSDGFKPSPARSASRRVRRRLAWLGDRRANQRGPAPRPFLFSALRRLCNSPSRVILFFPFFLFALFVCLLVLLRSSSCSWSPPASSWILLPDAGLSMRYGGRLTRRPTEAD